MSESVRVIQQCPTTWTAPAFALEHEHRCSLLEHGGNGAHVCECGVSFTWWEPS